MIIENSGGMSMKRIILFIIAVILLVLSIRIVLAQLEQADVDRATREVDRSVRKEETKKLRGAPRGESLIEFADEGEGKESTSYTSETMPGGEK